MPRYVKGYPKRKESLISRRRRGNVDRNKYRQKRPRIHASPYRYRTSFDEDAAIEARAKQGIHGSLQERLVYKALEDNGLIPGVDFSFQSSQLGGRARLGGMVADFIFEVAKVVVQVQSVWHTMSLAHEVRDSDQALILRDMGYTVLELWPETIEDPAALDLWIERHIMTLYGTSSQGLGTGGSAVASYLMQTLSPTRMMRLLEKLQLIYKLLTGKAYSG